MTMATLPPDDLSCRAAVYRLLARLWQRELDSATLDKLQRAPLREAYLAAGGSVPQQIDAALLDELASDYCQLFLGPRGHVPPYQSVWTEGRFHGAAVASLREYFALLTTRQWEDVEMPDHIAIAFEVMAYLLEQLQPSDCTASQQAATLDLTAAFFRDHVAWIEPLCAAAGQRAQTQFYRDMIRVTSRFFVHEAANWLASHDELAACISVGLGHEC